MSEGNRKNKWQVQEAKARFSTLLDTTLENGPQIVTKRGVEAVVVVPYDQWLRVEESRKPDIKELLLAPEPRFELPIPPRRTYTHRPPPAL